MTAAASRFTSTAAWNASYGGVSGQLVTGSGDLRVGMENTWSPEYLYGSVQEVGIWNAALTEQ